MVALCTNVDSCGGFNLGVGWEYVHRLSIQRLKKFIDFVHFTTYPKCSGRSERIAA